MVQVSEEKKNFVLTINLEPFSNIENEFKIMLGSLYGVNPFLVCNSYIRNFNILTFSIAFVVYSFYYFLNLFGYDDLVFSIVINENDIFYNLRDYFMYLIYLLPTIMLATFLLLLLQRLYNTKLYEYLLKVSQNTFFKLENFLLIIYIPLVLISLYSYLIIGTLIATFIFIVLFCKILGDILFILLYTVFSIFTCCILHEHCSKSEYYRVIYVNSITFKKENSEEGNSDERNGEEEKLIGNVNLPNYSISDPLNKV